MFSVPQYHVKCVWFLHRIATMSWWQKLKLRRCTASFLLTVNPYLHVCGPWNPATRYEALGRSDITIKSHTARGISAKKGKVLHDKGIGPKKFNIIYNVCDLPWIIHGCVLFNIDDVCQITRGCNETWRVSGRQRGGRGWKGDALHRRDSWARVEQGRGPAPHITANTFFEHSSAEGGPKPLLGI